MLFEKGDIVQVEYHSPQMIENWMRGTSQVGPGDLGVVAASTIADVIHAPVLVDFPMIGRVCVASSDLKLVQKCENT